MTLPIERSFEPAWLAIDIGLAFIPAIIDGLTGSWFYFDPVKVNISNDSTSRNTNNLQYIATQQIKNPLQKRCIFLLSGGMLAPMNQAVIGFNTGMVALGYRWLPALETFLAFGLGGYIDVTTLTYRVDCTLTSYQFETRGRFYENIYAIAGGGLNHIALDSVYFYSNGADHFPSSTKKVGVLFAGIGYSGSVGFIEIRHTFGLSKIDLPNGEKGKFETTALNFGLNLYF